MKDQDKLKIYKHRKSGMFLLLWNGFILMDQNDQPLIYYRRKDARVDSERMSRERILY